MARDFFISRAGADEKWGKWIAKELTEAHYTVVLQDWDFRPGQDFVAQMDSAMRTCDRTIAVLSRAYDQALFTVPEWTYAIARDPTGRNATLVPVRIEEFVPEGIFKSRIFIDLVGLEPDEARKRLLEGIEREPARTSIQFPGAFTTRLGGVLPPVWRAPSERNPVFTGRDEELKQIRESFRSPDPPPLIVAITGLGGVGKTALAVDYAHRESAHYKVVWWVRAQSRETIIADLALLAEQLEIADQGEELFQRAEAAHKWLAERDAWLLLVDDASDPAIARLAIPPGGDGRVIVTSQSPAWRRHATAVVALHPLADEPATDLLARRSGQIANVASVSLVRLLGGLPLAIELAGAFLEQQGLAPAEYVERVRRHGGLPVDEARYHPPDYRMALNAVWAESFRVVAARSPAASELLRLSAYLAPDDIPRPALVRGAADRLADLLAIPRAFSLVAPLGDGFSMHRLVQAELRDSMTDTERRHWAGSAVLLLDYVLPRQVSDFRLWSRTGRLISHSLTAGAHGVELDVEGQATLRLLDRGATYRACAGGEPDQVAAARESALRFARTLPGGPPGWTLNNQAEWLMAQHKNEEARPFLEEAIEITRRSEGGNSATLGVQWANLGNLLQRIGDFTSARTCLVRAIAILDRKPRSADQARATAHSVLGQVLFAQGERDAAAGHFAEAIRCYDAALGRGSLDSITARSFLAQALGENPSVSVQYEITPQSIALEEGKLLARERAWRDDAEQVLRAAARAHQPGAAVELAFALREQPRVPEAEAVLAEAAAAGDPQALYWHARWLGESGDASAEGGIRRSIAAGNAFSNYDLGLMLARDPSRRAEAEEAFRIAVDNGYDVARNDLGILLCEWKGREAEGEAILADAGRRGQPRCLANLAAYLRDHGRPEEAVAPLRAAAEDGYLQAYGTLAYLLENLGRYTEACAAFRAGFEAGDRGLANHLVQFETRHPELAVGRLLPPRRRN